MTCSHPCSNWTSRIFGFSTFAASLLWASAWLDAGEITNLTWYSGVASVAGDVISPPSAPNNDDVAGTSPNFIQVAQKAYHAIGPVDLVFDVVDTGGVTEYLFLEGVTNFTGVDWSAYRLELGFGHGVGYVQSLSGDELDFDTPDSNSDVDFMPFFSTVVVSEDEIQASGGTIPNTASAWPILFHIDVPDGIESFTIRQSPIGIPEPTAWILACLGLMVLVPFRRE